MIALNRAMSVGKAYGAAAGLALVDGLEAELASNAPLQRFHWIAAARAELLSQLGRFAEAQQEFMRAAYLTQNGSEQAILQNKSAQAAAQIQTHLTENIRG